MRAGRAYARLLGRARRGDAAAAPLVGLIVAAVIYLLVFAVLLAVTSDSGDANGVEYRVLSDRAESSLSLLLAGAGEGAQNVTLNPYLEGTATTVRNWTALTGFTRGTYDSRSVLAFDSASMRASLEAERAFIWPGSQYAPVVTLAGTARVWAEWWRAEDSSQPVRRDLLLDASGGGWAAASPVPLDPPFDAARVSLYVEGTTFWIHRAEIRTLEARSWEGNADGLVRFGLLEENLSSYGGFAGVRLPNVLDYDKMAALRRGSMTHLLNNGADYPDVQRGLGLEGYNFHLRTYPVFPALGSGFAKDIAVEPAYIGHYVRAPPRASMGVTMSTGADYVEVAVQVTNIDGPLDMPYRLTFTLNGTSKKVVDEQDTPAIDPGESVTVRHRIYGYTGAWALGTKIQVRLQDANSNIPSDNSDPPVLQQRWYALPSPIPSATNTFNVAAQPASAYFVRGNDVQIFLDHYDREGNRLNGQSATVTIKRPDGTTAHTQTVSLPRRSQTDVTCPATACNVAGVYTLQTTHAGLTTTEEFEVLVDDPADVSLSQAESSRSESATLDELLQKYDDVRNDGSLPVLAADKFMDTRSDTERLVHTRLKNPDGTVRRNADGSLYTNFLMVGSSVAHSAMTSAYVKYGISDWVYAGGTLVVMGSDAQNVEWLQPLSGNGLRGASGGIGAPDPTHPVLNSPEKLSYGIYKDPERAWELKLGAEEDYTHVLVRTQSTKSSDDMLGISRPGVFGQGTVVLSAYQPWDLLAGNGPEEDLEEKRFLHNMVSEAYSMLYVDFGPQIPSTAQVASTSRLVLVPHPLVDGALVEVVVTMYVFR